jgi:hypothetical protein
MGKRASLTTHHFSSADAPLLPLPHVQGNHARGGPGVQPPGRGELRYPFYRLFTSRMCDFWKIDKTFPGGLADPRSPRKNAIGAGMRVAPVPDVAPAFPVQYPRGCRAGG